MQMAGGAFNFITVTFGEFPGWLTACNLFITWCVHGLMFRLLGADNLTAHQIPPRDYRTVANAAVGKGFSGYFCALTG